jgi:hypothetical protein
MAHVAESLKVAVTLEGIPNIFIVEEGLSIVHTQSFVYCGGTSRTTLPRISPFSMPL